MNQRHQQICKQKSNLFDKKNIKEKQFTQICGEIVLGKKRKKKSQTNA